MSYSIMKQFNSLTPSIEKPTHTEGETVEADRRKASAIEKVDESKMKGLFGRFNN